ncbi:MAG: amidohydrolase family protein, partial [Burkholderiales bacterium]|nr:amidohydrolase family protein [Anaerolineae bacterium]
LSDVSIIDHHAHSLLKTSAPMAMERCQGFFSESGDPLVKQRDVPYSIMWQWGIRELAGYLGCEPTPEAVLAARNALSLVDLANGMWRDQNSEMLLIDYGFRGAENYTPEELGATFNQRVELVMRLETFAQDLILQHNTFSKMLDAFVAGVESARSTGHVSLKSIIAYRTGLDIQWRTRDEAERAFGEVKDQADREGSIRLASKPLCDYLVLAALEFANRQEMPIQFHTGFGDADVDLLKANPLNMRPLLQSDKFRNVPFVLLHAAYPYARELGYLAAMYPNVYMDLSLAIPFVTTLIPTIIHEALALTPMNKVLYSSDAFSIPEIFWLANRWGRAAIERVLGEIVDAGALTPAQARRAGEQILSGNSRAVYQLT